MDYTVRVIEALIIIGGIIGVAAVGLSVSGRMTKWWSSALYALIVASLAVLMISGLSALTTENPIALLWYGRIGVVSVVVATACLYFLMLELVESSRQDVISRSVSGLVVGGAVLLIAIAFTPAMFPSAYFLQDGRFYVDADWGAVVLILYLSTAFTAMGYYLISQARGAYHRRYGVIDVRFVAVRTVAYLFTLVSTLFVYCVGVYILAALFLFDPAVVFQSAFSPVFVGGALLAAIVFQPIRRSFNRIADKLLYKDNYSIGTFAALVSQTLNSTNDTRTLLERTATVIAATLRAKQAFFFVQLADGRYMIAGTEQHSRVSPAEFEGIEEGVDAKTRSLLVTQFDLEHPLHRMMASHRLGLIKPLYKGDVLVGYLCLGRSLATGFTSRDLKALRIVSDEVTIAIQNSLSVEEVKKLNDTLEQRVGAATRELRLSNAQLHRLDEAKDEFISMASHQLRTPLTSIKGYISMMLEGDVGKITKEQRHVLNEAFVSSERMVRLIGDFLNVSRLQTGKFVIEKHPVDLARLVERELDGLLQNATSRGMKFVYKKPKDLPLLTIDENKIQQVVMNFADNALYYSKEKSKITVSLQQVGEWVEFRVVDTGIGVPKEEQAQLFNKFFRATNARRARPDGTGVGLFLAKKVIHDHKGSIIFESTEGVGSTFGFRLPLK